MKKTLMLGIVLNALVSGVAAAEIRIGVAAPMTGSSAAFGEQFRAGAEQAIDDINAKGGVNGERLRLLIGDDACDPKQAVSVANRLASEGAVFVAGHFCSGSSIPASRVYDEERVIQISPGSTNPVFTDQRPGKGIFRVCGRDDQQGQVGANYIIKQFPNAKVAVIHDKSAWGKGVTDTVLKTLQAGGKKPALVDSFSAGERDYTALVTKLKQAGIDVLYAGGYYTEVGLITRQMREQGLKAVVIGGDALFTDEYWAITGKSGDGTLMTFAPDPRRNKAAAPVVAAMQAKGRSAEGYALYTYAAIQAWAEAVRSAGSTDYEKVVDALNNGKFETVIGTVDFDKKGDVTLPGFVVYEWRDGKYDYAQAAQARSSN
ncbi:branched-chain amino acid ABC transporter substrate-binding protein [Arenibaculum pallidiluteum]|uniref:branched-chain amino acid ABC transporter substrate-binding protein n=1 Tax=Arenibaculum pallidiluteum TaxID=2812559 RepID=UPI001A960FD7|nr:branched-chain amino acid ABC transporter substrate-binding protein [Arenibaculum pallidiluteum]